MWKMREFGLKLTWCVRWLDVAIPGGLRLGILGGLLIIFAVVFVLASGEGSWICTGLEKVCEFIARSGAGSLRGFVSTSDGQSVSGLSTGCEYISGAMCDWVWVGCGWRDWVECFRCWVLFYVSW